MIGRVNIIKTLGDPTFAKATWEQVANGEFIEPEIVYNDPANAKDIQLSTGEVLTLQIYGKGHDDLTAGGKARYTIGMKNLMATTRQMNTSGTNVGGFTGSQMYTGFLNNNTFFLTLPSDLRAGLKSANKKTSAGNAATNVLTQSMSLFLFSEVECFGTVTYSVAGEGTKYPIFTNNTSRIKYLSNGAGSANNWWERSPYASNSSRFCGVHSGGNFNLATASETLGVCFGFCVGVAPPKPLGEYAIGDTVLLGEGTAAREYIVVHHGKPSGIYDNSFNNGTIVLKKDIEISDNIVWNDPYNNNYAGSSINAYLNNTFINTLNASVRNKITTVKIPYRPGSGTGSTISSGANGLSCRVFLASGFELGWDSSQHTYMPADGATFDYFKNTAAQDAKRIAYFTSPTVATNWWLRSPSLSNPNATWLVTPAGAANDGYYTTSTCGARPCFVLPDSTML